MARDLNEHCQGCGIYDESDWCFHTVHNKAGQCPCSKCEYKTDCPNCYLCQDLCTWDSTLKLRIVA